MCIWRTETNPKEFAQFIGKEMVLAPGHYVEYARAESGPIFNFYLGKNTPACVAVANSENEQTEPSHMEADATVQHTSARRRPERKDYITDQIVKPVEECGSVSR